MPTNILYISYDGMTDPLGQSQVLPYLVGLSKRGFSFTLISCEKKQHFAKQRSVIEDICRKANIDWRPISYSKRPPVLSTIYDVQKIKKIALQLYKQKQFGAVHCRSYLSALVGLDLKRKHGLPFIFDMRGFWADERLDGNIWSLKNPVYKKVYQFFKKKELEYFSEADYTISLTERGKKEIQTWDLPNQPIPIEVIPCCADLNVFDYKEIDYKAVDSLREELKLETTDFVLGYLGSIGTWYCLKEMLLFFQQLSKKDPNAKFLFITKENPATILAEAKKINISTRDIIIKSADRMAVPNYLTLINCGIFFIKPVFSKSASSPTKQAEMMAMGLPVICNDIGDTGIIVSENKVGISLNDFSVKEMDRAIAAIPELMRLPKNGIRKVATDQFALSKGIDRYEKVYNEVLQLKFKNA